MKNIFLIIILSFFLLVNETQAQEAQPGAACSGAGTSSWTGGPEQIPGRLLICNGSTWQSAQETANTGRTLFQNDYDSGTCDSSKDGRLRYDSAGNAWHYCYNNSWSTFGSIPSCVVGQGLTVSGTGWKCCPGLDLPWTIHNAAQANSWEEIAYGNGTFVAISSDGTNRVMTSTNGTTWTARTASQANPWKGITYGNGLFVAVANNGTNRVMTSPDGITWTNRTAAQANQWEAVTYGNGLFVAVAQSGTNRVMTSPNGITWTARTAASADVWLSVEYGNGMFVALDYSNGRIMSSPDGITWTTQTIPSGITWANWMSLAYGNGTFVAVALGASSSTRKLMTSPDGITWTSRTISNVYWNSVTYGGGIFVALGDNRSSTQYVGVSLDGINWQITSAASAVSEWPDIVFGNNKFVGISVGIDAMKADLLLCP